MMGELLLLNLKKFLLEKKNNKYISFNFVKLNNI